VSLVYYFPVTGSAHCQLGEQLVEAVPFELECLHDGIRRGVAVEDTVEAVLVAFGVFLAVAPGATVAAS